VRWNFPIRRTITCSSCGEQFELVLTSRNSERHPCPNCGTIHRFDFAAVEKKAVNEAKAALKEGVSQVIFHRPSAW
jgi:predicted RNA-binding Zn-ribbon protein involved in translation (DUF1610 family)